MKGIAQAWIVLRRSQAGVGQTVALALGTMLLGAAIAMLLAFLSTLAGAR